MFTHHIIYQAETTPTQWETADDRVMGGVSVANMTPSNRLDLACSCLSGRVSLENRGGFLQMKWSFDPPVNGNDFKGVYLHVLGNNESYNLHIRTNQLWLPWQSFRASFMTESKWQFVYLPFSQFENYKTFSTIDPEHIKKIAIVAIGRVFEADVCIHEMGFYS